MNKPQNLLLLYTGGITEAPAGYQPNWVIYDSADQVALVREVLRALNFDEKRFPPKAVPASSLGRASTSDLGAISSPRAFQRWRRSRLSKAPPWDQGFSKFIGTFPILRDPRPGLAPQDERECGASP